jgi:hypothetical protein
MTDRTDRPPYVEKKRLKDGSLRRYFNPPTWARAMGCPIPHTTLGTNKQDAYNHVWNVLYPQFLSWLTKGATDVVAKRMAEGSFEWLVLHQYPGLQEARGLDPRRPPPAPAEDDGDQDARRQRLGHVAPQGLRAGGR